MSQHNGNMKQDMQSAKEHTRIAAGSAKGGYQEGMREGSYPGSNPSSDEIRRDIGRTRTDLDRTLEALEDRLSPERIVDRVVDRAMGWVDHTMDRAKTSGAGDRLSGMAQGKALPLTLIGLGAGWLAAEMISGKRRASTWRVRGGEYTVTDERDPGVPPGHSILDDEGFPEEDLDVRPVYSDRTGSKLGYEQTVPGGASGVTGPAPIGPGGDVGTRRDISGYGRPDIGSQRPELEMPAESAIRERREHAHLEPHVYTPPGRPEKGDGPRGSTYGAVRGRAGNLRHRAEDIGHRAGGWAGDVRERASGVFGSAGDYAGNAGHAIRENAAAATSAVAHQTKVVGERACDTYERHPLALGLLALGAGVLAGIALPASRRENEWFGAESDDVYRRARRAGQEAMRRGAHAAEHVGEAARDAAGLEDIHGPDDIAEAARGAARDAMSAARAAAEAASHAAKEELEEGLHEATHQAEEQMGGEEEGDQEGQKNE